MPCLILAPLPLPGPFLNDQPEHPWVLSALGRLRGKCLRALGSASTALTQAQRRDQAIHCLENGLMSIA